MLYLTRKIGQSIMIGNDVEIVVVSVTGGSVKFGIVFSKSVTVLRKEVFDKIKKQNEIAGNISDTDLDILE